MGGDDLGSDDEFLTAPVRAEGDDDDSSNGATVEISKSKVTKRDIDVASVQSDHVVPTKKRRKDGGNTLLGLGSDVRNLPAAEQAKLLSDFTGVRFSPHDVSRSDESVESQGIAKRVQGLVSKKKLKKWKTKNSPCVVIVCLSARRAMQILKELAPLNVRAAKLFAKHITVEEQVNQLQDSAFGIAVGTPHRVLTLAQQGALSIAQTQCVVLDTFVNGKKYSVYTLPDTVAHTQEFLKMYVQPECSKRKDIRMAFV